MTRSEYTAKRDGILRGMEIACRIAVDDAKEIRSSGYSVISANIPVRIYELLGQLDTLRRDMAEPDPDVPGVTDLGEGV